MTDDALLLVGREADGAREVYEHHASRLRRRDVAGSVHVATYGTDPQADIRDRLSSIPATRVHAVPLCMAHTNVTTAELPAAFAAADADVRYCEPVGRSPSTTRAILDRAREATRTDGHASLVLAGLGNTTGSYHRRMVEYHTARVRERADYAAVVACYLTQNPTVECVRYNVPTEAAVAVPLFVAPSAATEERIPAKLELDRGGIGYSDPLGTHPAVTDAIRDRLETGRVLADSVPGPASFEAALAETARPVATDGDGRPRSE